MLLDEGDEKIYVRSLKDMGKEADVFIIDHAWTYRQRGAYPMLLNNEPLRERLDKLMKYSGKRSLPGENPFTKEKKPTLEAYLEKIEA